MRPNDQAGITLGRRDEAVKKTLSKKLGVRKWGKWKRNKNKDKREPLTQFRGAHVVTVEVNV